MKPRQALWRHLRGRMMRTLPLMITCREFEDFLIDYFEGALPRGQRLVFDWHLRLCPECRVYLEAFKRTMALTKASVDEADAAVLETIPEDLVQAILAAREAEADANRDEDQCPPDSQRGDM